MENYLFFEVGYFDLLIKITFPTNLQFLAEYLILSIIFNNKFLLLIKKFKLKCEIGGMIFNLNFYNV